MRKKILMLFILLPMLSIAQKFPYMNPELTPQERAEDLLHRMTTDEKIAQLQCIWTENKKKLFTDEKFDEKKATEYFKDGLGFMSRPNENLFPKKPAYHPALHPRQAAELYNQIQRYFVEKTRLGIPLVAHDEGVHGHLSRDATNFPVPIALACTWNEELIHDVFTITAKEIRSKGGSEELGPVLDMVRDPRWGRTEETMGEDPYLISRLGRAAVSGAQGIGEYIDPEHVGVTLKHFGVHGASEGGNNTAPSYVDEHEARQSFFFPFREVIRDCNPMYVMITYNEVWGRPAHANKRLLRDILRDEFKFKGTIVADYGGISNLHDVDKISPTLEDAAIQAINSGIDAEFPNPDTYPTLKQSLQEGKVSMEVIDRAVKNVLISKFRLGLFERPYVDVGKAEAINGCEAHRQVAYRAAAESMVLLKNDNDFLPLNKNKVKTIALIGPNADRCILGGYSGMPRDTITPLRAIREKQGDRMNILYSEGVRITDHHSPFPPVIKAYTYEDNARKIQDAVETAKRADVVVLFVGGNEGTSREAYGPEAPGDLPTLELLGGQKELIDRIVALGKPTCAFVNSGTTLSLGDLENKMPAVMQCWYLGQEGGYAMIDALFGDINPSGKLSISFPRNAGHIPAYYNYKPTSRRGYNLGFDVTPLHPFGYGLSYTTYAYSNLRINKSVMDENEIAAVSVDVQNTGNREGSEIVQMYITDDYASLTRPVKELKDFKRIHLKAGEKQTVTFKVDKDTLAYYDLNNKWQVEPGTFTIAVGTSSDKNEIVKLKVK
jgi:beta-glucosidase